LADGAVDPDGATDGGRQHGGTLAAGAADGVAAAVLGDGLVVALPQAETRTAAAKRSAARRRV